MDPIASLCAALFRQGVLVSPAILEAALADTGQTLSHGVRALVRGHLEEVEHLGRAVANAAR